MNAIVLITLMVGVVHVCVQNDLINLVNKDIYKLAYRSTWIVSFSVSALCCYYYVKLVFNFRLRLLYEQCQRCGALLVVQVMVALICLAGVSTYSLVQQMQLIGSEAQGRDLPLLWKTVFITTTFAGVLQRLLASKPCVYVCVFTLTSVSELFTCSDYKTHSVLFYNNPCVLTFSCSAIFTCLALPVAKRWVCEMNPEVKSTLLELLPWKVFLFLNRNILFTLSETSLESYSDTVYILNIGFRGFCLIWLLFVVLYVGYDFAIPCKCDSQSQGRRELAGVYRTNLNYPSKSQVVTGLSPRHYALRYKVFSPTGEVDRETKARIKSNMMIHEQYRILLSQLD